MKRIIFSGSVIEIVYIKYVDLGAFTIEIDGVVIKTVHTDSDQYPHTNIDNLIGDITQMGFALRETRRLPFPGLPTLFKVCRFELA